MGLRRRKLQEHKQERNLPCRNKKAAMAKAKELAEEKTEFASIFCRVEEGEAAAWLAVKRPDEYKEIDAKRLSEILEELDCELYDSNNPFLGLTEEEAEEMEEMEG